MRVILFDSSGILHSCFHGYPPRSAIMPPRGHAAEVGALMGYLTHIKNLEREFECERLIHIMDPEGGSDYRFGMFPEYKGKRSPTSPALTFQKLLMPKVMEAFGQRFVCKKGVESDDVIATLAEKFVARGDQVLIISTDKDMLQLVRDGEIGVAQRVERGDGKGKTYQVYSEADVVKKMGVRPDQIADFLALVGDDADNIPGVFKCGEKTAAKWLEEYGDLATLMTHAADIGGKIGENLREALPKLPLYRKLTSVLRDVDGLGLMDEDPILEAGLLEETRKWLNIPTHWAPRLMDGWKSAEEIKAAQENQASEQDHQSEAGRPEETIENASQQNSSQQNGSTSQEAYKPKPLTRGVKRGP